MNGGPGPGRGPLVRQLRNTSPSSGQASAPSSGGNGSRLSPMIQRLVIVKTESGCA